MKYSAFSNVFIDGRSLQNLFIGFGATEVLFITSPNNLPAAVTGRVGGYVTAGVQKSKNKIERCKPTLCAAFGSARVKALRMLLLKVMRTPGPVKDAAKAQ